MILFKIFAVFVAFGIRFTSKYFYRFAQLGTDKIIDGIKLNVRKVTSKQNQVTATTYSIELKGPVLFKLTREAWIDGVFKNLGLTEEYQTGHSEFDQKIYVASDSYSFFTELRVDALSRELILKLFQTSCNSIYCDGENLSIYLSGDHSENTEIMNLFAQLSKQLGDLEKNHKTFFKDPYVVKILVAEALIWGLGAYATLSAFDWFATKEDIYLYESLVVFQGLKLGCFIALAFFVFVLLILKGSSRGHRIFVESFLVLSLSVPVGSINIISDINVEFDESKPIIVEAQVTDKYSREHRTKRGKYYTYHINVVLVNSTLPVELPRMIKVPMEVYNSTNPEKIVRIEIGQGRLNHQWYRSINNFTWY